MKRLTTAMIGLLLILTACSTSAAGGTVQVNLTDNKITPNVTSVPAGAVTFNVKNAGSMEHELVVIKTDLAEDKIPPDADEPGKVSEDGNVGESGDMDAGGTDTFTVQLLPGKYVLLCNEIGHYALGMHIAFTVK